MCTLSVNLDADSDYPLVVAANRDEFYHRPSAGPTAICSDPLIVAPRDLEGGGTWFGVNGQGLVAAITNIPNRYAIGAPASGPPPRSRGQLTLDALRCQDLAQAANAIRRSVAAETYQYFNLLLASTGTAIVFSYTDALKEFSLSAGNATILNFTYDPSQSDVDELPSLAAKDTADPDRLGAWMARVRAALARHPEVCKHGDEHGTRCSQIVALARRRADGRKPVLPDRFWYADGPPCTTAFVDLSGQLEMS